MTSTPITEASGTTCALLADRHTVSIEGIRDLLGTAFNSVYTVGDTHSLCEGAQRLRPNVIVFDISFARSNSLGLIRKIKGISPGSKLITLTIHDQESAAQISLSAGADAIVLKRCIARDLLEAVDAVQRDESFISADIGVNSCPG